jgi:hypothetical protein
MEMSFGLSAMKGIINNAVIMCLAGASLACSYTNSRKYETAIVNHRSEPIYGATIVPLVSTRSALRVGPDGAGPETEPIGFVGKPLLWNSGDDLRPSTLRSSATMIVPMVAVGKDVTVYKWLVLKKGYGALMLTNERSSIYYSGGPALTAKGQKKAPFHLTPGGDVNRRRIISVLSASQPDKAAVGSIFGWEIDTARLSDEDRRLIQLQE